MSVLTWKHLDAESQQCAEQLVERVIALEAALTKQHAVNRAFLAERIANDEYAEITALVKALRTALAEE